MREDEPRLELPPPFLDSTPPVWAARGLSSVLLLLSLIAAVGLFTVQVPETVTASFVLTPQRGTDPVRAFRSGVVGDVRVAESQPVSAGEVMFAIASTAIADRAAEWQSLESQIRGAGDRLTMQRRRDRSEQLAEDVEVDRLRTRLASLTRALALRKEQLALSLERARRQKHGFEKGLVPWMEMARAQTEADNLALELELAEAELSDVRRSVDRTRHQASARRAESSVLDRTVIEDLERARIRRATLDDERLHQGNRLVVTAPCAGVVLKLVVRNRGAIVQEGEVLAELSCGEAVHAELRLPQAGAGRIRTGQRVKLLYTAFPYQRHGAQSATIRWISPSGDPTGLRVFAALDKTAIIVDGQPRVLSSGMDGQARILVGRRRLVSYAFEPIRQIRENLAADRPM